MRYILLLSSCIIFSIYSLKAYDTGRAPYTVTVNGEENPYEIFSTFVMPGEEVNLQSSVTIDVSAVGLFPKQTADGWTVTAPELPGAHSLSIMDPDSNLMVVNVLVLTPLSSKNGEYLNGYRIGNYPAKPLKGNPIYNQPKGLFEITDANEHIQLTPHFTAAQFKCKQAGGYPKYIMVRERLLLKLEYLLEKVNEEGIEIETFGFISGYRTPFYNASIKNVQYSRHVWGGAADIFIDQNKNGSMDDLDGDGKTTESDVRIFYNIVSNQYNQDTYKKFRGGLGFYRGNGRHNGFIHVDVRGYKARW